MFVYQRLLLMLSREMRRQITTFLDLIVHPSGVPRPLWTPTPPRIPEEGSRCFFLHLRAISKIGKDPGAISFFHLLFGVSCDETQHEDFPIFKFKCSKNTTHTVACWCMLDTFLQRYKRSSPYPSLSVTAFKVGPKNQLQMGWFFFALWQLRVFSNTPRQTHPIDFPFFFFGGPLSLHPHWKIHGRREAHLGTFVGNKSSTIPNETHETGWPIYLQWKLYIQAKCFSKSYHPHGASSGYVL